MFKGIMVWLAYFVIVISAMTAFGGSDEIDPKGYVVYCPCMGRFGNQADHFLGALNFAKGLDRTLILPPWVEYRPRSPKSVQVPFDTYFKVEAINEYHRAITMEYFMKKLAPTIWPEGKRISICYTGRGNDRSKGCSAKDGNPFGPFWDTFNIDFDASEFYGPLNYNTESSPTAEAWHKKFPADKFPVLAFTGAPAQFPVREVDIKLHKYLRWSNQIESNAESFIKKQLQRPFLGIHMRNGIDWKRACDHVSPDRNMFASAQCLGFRLEHGKLTEDICYPSDSIVLNQIKKTVKKMDAKSIFVAADDRHMIPEIQKIIKKLKKDINVVKYQDNSPHTDLAILAQADHYIGNCISTFSGFATRERLVTHQRPSTFWAFKPSHDEL